MENQPLKFVDLGLRPGQVLELEFDGITRRRERSVLVGYTPSHSIIVTPPVANGSTVPVTLESCINVRLFSSQLNVACAFSSTINYLTNRPFPLLFLSMPEQMELGEIRDSIRASIGMIANVTYGADRSAPSTILDLSTGGARIASTQLQVSVGDEIVVNWQCKFAEIERSLSIRGTVRSANETEKEILCGIQFHDINEIDLLTLYAFVLTSLYRIPTATKKPQNEYGSLRGGGSDGPLCPLSSSRSLSPVGPELPIKNHSALC